MLVIWVELIGEGQNLGGRELNVAFEFVLTRQIKVLLLIKAGWNFWSDGSQRRLLLCVIYLSSAPIILCD